ncbi:hypothetical protein M514_24971 [Trichuris suis]|uniref:Uncharacterized protein n=1 Tax=Trichuris suis TaxID=68888 RepID=A0A085N054_9BILA|nr:hypothetical protein M514_24971 [Trichuris suis]
MEEELRPKRYEGGRFGESTVNMSSYLSTSKCQSALFHSNSHPLPSSVVSPPVSMTTELAEFRKL